MRSIIQRLHFFSRQIIRRKFNAIHVKTTTPQSLHRHFHTHHNTLHVHDDPTNKYHHNSVPNSDEFQETTQIPSDPDEKTAIRIQTLLKTHRDDSIEVIEKTLEESNFTLNDDLVFNVLRRHRSDWKPAYTFFNWVCKSRGGDDCKYLPGSGVYNVMLDVLGKMKRFDEVNQVLDEMSKREGLINERCYGIVVNRFAGAHKIEEATDLFYRRRQFGLPLDLIAFQTLLMALCRYRHAEAAEFLFHSKQNKFRVDIKTMNIILNGWCVLGRLRDAKRFWNDILTSKCKPDKYTYGIFINSLAKAGKLSSAVKLFRSMWEKGCAPDVTICNCIIDALCFKKRVNEALEIFNEMNDKDCSPDVATYNSLIKHLCIINRMGKVCELLNEMEQRKGSCLPNARTYGYLLKSVSKPEEVDLILDRMEKNGCKMSGDTYNLILKLYMDWDDHEKVRSTWIDMEKNGLGPDQRSYTIMIHGLFDNGRTDEALSCFHEMVLKGMMPEPRTSLLVNAMNIELTNEKESNSSKTHDSTVLQMTDP